MGFKCPLVTLTMKKLLLLFAAIFAFVYSNAQLSGTYTIDPAGSGARNYTTFSAALSSLNTVGINAPVTFLVKDDATFNETAELDLYATGTAANTITFIRSNDGANKPVIKVPAVGSAPYEMLFCSGSDYITLDGLDFRATSTNTTRGIVFSANGTNGCRNNLIQNCNIQLNAANTTNTCFGIEFLFNSTSSNLNNNNKVNNNTISNVNQGIRFAGSGGGYDSGNEANGNSITNLGNTGTNQVIFGINIDYQLNAKISNNLIQFNPASQTSNLDVAGIRSGSGANTLEINGNTIKDANIAQGNTSEYFRGIYIATGATTSMHDNTIQNFAQTSTSGGCDVWGIKIESGNSTVYNNVIKDITNASTSGSARIIAMETSAGSSNSFYNNKIFNLTSTGSGTNAGIEGLRIHTGSSNANIYNNMFYNLKCANGSINPTVAGILLVSGNCNVYNNTVYIDNNSSTSGNISTALYTSTSGTIDLRNNIFICNGTNTNGAWNIALFRNNSAFNLSATSNNNLYYAGTPGNNNKIYHTANTGTPTANTLLDYQAAVAPKENTSVTEAATPFVSTIGTYDLHIKTDVPTLVEGHGVPITTPVNITADIDGDTRNASTPDLGADEGDFMQTPYIVATQNNVTATSRGLVNQEIIGVVINTNSTPSATSFTFNTTGSTSAQYDIVNAKLWYTGTSSTFATTMQVGSAAVNPSGTFTITGDQTLTAGDNYFWLTYDVTDGATVNNVLDAQCTSVTAAGIAVTPQLTAPTGSRSINGLLSGIYTINPTGSGARNFTTVTTAINALNVGIAGPVTFLVKDDATFNEVATLTINTTGTAENTITFQRSDEGTNKPKILFTGTSSTDACFRLNSCDYITFDGLEIQANGTNSNNFAEWGFYLYGAATDGCQHNTIKNCDISFATANTALTYGIYLASVATNTAGANSYNTFLNNTILRPTRGYYMIGATGSYDVNNKVSTENNGVSSISEIGYGNSAYSTFGVEYQYQTNLEFANTNISFKSASAITSATDHIEGIYSRNGNNTASLHDNTISNLKVNKSDNALYVGGIYLEANTSVDIYNNTIQTIDNQNTNSSAVWAIKVSTGGSACNIYNNVITDIKNNSTSIGRVVGIESAGTTSLVYNNRIYNLNYVNNSSVGTWGNVVGILAYTGTTATIYNNMIYDLKAASSVANAVSGITFTCTNVNLYNNTVYLDYTSTNASNTSACVWQQNTGTLDMRNNIFINKSVMTTGTRAIAFYKTAGTISSTTNNNLYYAGTPGAKNLIYYTGTAYQTLANYQAAVSPKDDKAVTEDATPFISTSGTSDLHIETNVSTLVESHGTPITTPVNIATDIDGNTRNASTPDLGADEGDFAQTPYIVTTQSNVTATSRGLVNQEIIAVVINTSTTPTATSFTFNTTGSTNAATDIANAKLWYTGTSGTFATTAQVGSAVATPSGTFTITGSQSLIAGDNYFWLTYDVADGAIVNNVLDAQCALVTVNGTDVTPQVITPTGSRSINGLLSGIYTIDPAGSGARNFTTFTAAITALNVGIAGSVTFNVADGATFTSSALNITTTGTAANTITFQQSGTGTKPVVNVTSSGYLIKVNGGDYFTFDGLSIVNSSGSATYGLYFAGAAANGCQYNTVKNCVVTMNIANTADCWGIEFQSAATSVPGENNNNLISNNTLNNVTQAIRIDGNNQTFYDNNNEVANNTIIDLGTPNTSASIVGVTARYQLNLKIHDNDIQFRNNSFTPANNVLGIIVESGIYNTSEIYGNKIYGLNSSLTATNVRHVGIQITEGETTSIHGNEIHDLTQNTVNGSDLKGILILDGNADIYENQIYNLTNKSTSATSSVVGINTSSGTNNIYANKIYSLLSSGSGSSANAYGISVMPGTTASTIFNNMISGIQAPNSSFSPATTRGIDIRSGTANVYYNTVLLDYTSANASNSSACLYDESTVINNLDIRNNIFINNCLITSGIRAVAFWKGITENIVSSTSNNNLYYAGTPGTKNLVYYAPDKTCQALSDYKTFVTPRENNSVTESPTPFLSAVSPYDLHIDATQSTIASNTGTVISSVTTDIDGDTRNSSTPDMGADEFWAPQTITFTLDPKTYGDDDFTLPLNSSSGLPITYASDNSLIATISGNTVHIVGAGTCSITANQTGNASYYPALEVTQTLTVNKADPTITLDDISKYYGDASFTVEATSNSTGAFTYSSSNEAVATITENIVTIVGAGTATITASQATDDNYKAATGTALLTVNKPFQTITFAPLAEKTYGDEPFILSATASSGLDVTFSSDNPDVAVVSGNQVTIVGAGSAIITASQAGNSNYSSANDVFQTLTVNQASQTITFGTLSGKTYGDTDFTLSGTASSGLSVNYASDNTAVATVSGTTITIVGAGTAHITASQTGNTNYSSATEVVQTLTVNKQDQTITFGTLADKTYGDSDFTLSATASSGLDVTYTSNNTAVATVSGNTVTIIGAGTANILASQAGNTNYNAATQVSQSLKVNKQTQTITFGTLADKTYGDSDFTLSATASSGLGITYTSDNTAVATISGNAVTIVGAGTANILANQAGNTNYSAAPQVSQSLKVNKQTQTITFGTLTDKAFGDAPFTVSATGGTSGNPVTFTSSDDLIATCTGTNGTTITVIGAGICTIYANQAGNVNYSAAGQVGQLLTVGKSAQSITFDALPAKTFGDIPFSLAGTASSSLPVSYISSNLTVATVLGDQVTIVGAGSTIIKASQTGNVNYDAATNVEQTLVVDKANQALTLNPLPVGELPLRDFASTPVQVTASSSSGLPVVISLGSGSVATLNGSNQLESIGTIGNVIINVDQAGDDNYNAASVSHSFDVVKSNQSITFGALANQTYSPGLTLELSATASSTLAVGYTVVSGPATLSGNTLNISGAGEIVITASQAGNETWNPATDVTQSLTVEKASQTITFGALANKTYGDAPFTLTGTASSGLSVSYISSNTAVATISGNQLTIVGAGTTSITASQIGNPNYNAATDVVQSLTVNKQTQVITFDALADKNFDDAPFSVSATGGTSGNPVTFTSSNNSIATCTGANGSTITIFGSGRCTIYANQAGNVNYSAAAQVEQELSVGMTPQTITFNALADKTYGDVPFALSATASSGLNVTYTSDNELVATVSGNMVTIVGAGTANILANQAGNTNYNAAIQVSQSLTVNKKAQTITFGTLTDKTYGDASFTLSATASSGLDVSYTSDNTDVATVSGNMVTIVGAGTANILVNQAGNTNYSAATQVSQSLTVNKKAQTITFGTLAEKTYGDAPFTLSATASSGMDVSYTSDNELVATVSGNTVTIAGAGTANILANQAGNTNYSAAPQVSQSLTVNKKAQTIDFATLADKTYGDSDFTLSATASSGLDVTYTSDNTDIATVSGNTVTIVGGGTANILANQAGNTNYSAATQVSQSLTVNKQTQTITFGVLAAKTYGDTPFTLSATASSGLDVTYTSDNTAVATVSGNTVTIVGAGTANIRANQSGNTNYSAATQVSQSLTVNKKAQTITFGTLADKTYGDAPFTLAATASSGLNVTYTSDNTDIATVSGNTVTIVGAGTANIFANQAGSTNYSAATQVSQSLTVNKQAQAITFGTLADKTYGDASFTLSATASSGLDVTYTSDNTAVATISGNTVTVVGAGTANIFANQAGNTNYSAATQVSQSLTVNKKAQTITLQDLPTKVYGDVPFNLTGTSSSGLAVTYSSSNTDVATILGNTVTIVGTGTTSITASQAGSVNYSPADDVIKELTVSKANQVITLGALPVGPLPLKNFTDPIQVTASSSSGLPVVISLGAGSAATLNGSNQLESISQTGNVIINVDQAGNDNYNAATVQYTFDVVKSNQAITFPALASQPYSPGLTVDINGAATASSNLDVSYNVVSGPASLSGTSLTITGAGTVIIKASQGGDATWNPATDVTQTLAIGKATPVIANFDNLSKIYGELPFTLNATSESTGLFNYTSSNAAVAIIEGNIVIIIGTGETTLTAEQDFDDNYLSATATATLSVGLTEQLITFGSLDTKVVGDPDFVMSATGGGSGNPVIFTSSDESVAKCTGTDGETVKIIGEGTCTIYANQAGNSNYSAATEVSQQLTVYKYIAGDINRDGQITSPEIAGDTNGDGIIGSGEIAGDKDGDGSITSPEIAGDTNGDGLIGTGEIAGDTDGDGTIGAGEIAGDKDGDGTITSPEIAGDTNGDGIIGSGEITGDTNGDGSITSPEIAGDTNGDGTIGTGEVAGDKDGDGHIGTGEVAGDKDGDGTITSPEIAGDTNGDGQIGTIEVAGDKDGDGTITSPEIAGDTNGDGQIGTGEVAGDKDGDGTITSPEIAGDTNGNGTITSPEIAGDTNGDGTISTGEVAGDKDGNGTITSPEIAGDTNGDGIIGGVEVEGDSNGDGQINNGEVPGNTTKSNQTITFGELVNKTFGDSNFNLNAIASSGLSVSYTSSNESVATISGNTVTITGTGITTITAMQSGNSYYNAASLVTRILVVVDYIAGDVNHDGQITSPEIAGDTNGDGQIGTGEVAGDKNGDGTITAPEIAGDTNGDGQIGNGEAAGDKDGDGTITSPEIAGDTNGDGQIGSGEIAGDKDGNGTITSPEIAGDTNGDGQIGNGEIAGDTNGDGSIDGTEVTGDTDGNGTIDGTEVKGDSNGDGTADTTVIAGDTNGDGKIGNGEIAGDTNGDGKITSPEVAGDTNGDGKIDNGELAGDTDGDGQIGTSEVAGDTNGDGSIGGTEVTGDTDGNGTIDGTEVKGDSNGDGTADTTVIAGDTNGDGKIGDGEIAGDTDGDGQITSPEVAGDTNGDGKIDNGEVAGDINGDGTIGGNEVSGDSNGDGQVSGGETSQSIVFLPLENKHLGDKPFVVSATGGYSGNPVTFTSSDISVATCSGTNGEIVTIVGIGTCTITAHQDGNSIFSAATDVPQVFKVDFNVGIEDNPKEDQLVAYAIRNIEIRIKGEVSRGAVATLYDMSGRVVRIATLEEGILNVMPTPGLKTAIYVLSVNDHGKVQIFKIPVRE